MMMREKDPHGFAFQNLKRKFYFEGWYYKMVTKDRRHTLSIIPSFHRVEGQEFSMVQVIWARLGQQEVVTDSVTLPGESFCPLAQPAGVRIGKSYFWKDGISLNLEESRLFVQGQVFHRELHPLPSSLLAPNIMGLFDYVPGMECIHSIISMNHGLEGRVKINDEILDFTGGRGYMEKDWGSSFPTYYLWVQSNHFVREIQSLFVSWAKIPIGKTSFDGFIANVLVKGEHIRFATYQGDSCTVETMDSSRVYICLKNREYTLRLVAVQKEGAHLAAPKQGAMDSVIKEGLMGELLVQLIHRKTGNKMEDRTRSAGIEFHW